VQVTLPVAIAPPATVPNVPSDVLVTAVTVVELAELDEHPASTATRTSGSKKDARPAARRRVDAEVTAISMPARPSIFP